MSTALLPGRFLATSRDQLGQAALARDVHRVGHRLGGKSQARRTVMDVNVGSIVGNAGESDSKASHAGMDCVAVASAARIDGSASA